MAIEKSQKETAAEICYQLLLSIGNTATPIRQNVAAPLLVNVKINVVDDIYIS